MDKENVYVYVYTVEYYSAIERMKSCVFNNMDWPWGHYTEWNKSDRERQILPHLYVETKNPQHTHPLSQTKLIDTKNRSVVARGLRWGGEMGKESPKVQTSSYKISPGYVIYSMVT